MSLTASQARASLFPLIAQVNDDAKPLHITSKSGNAVLIAESEWESILETLFLFTNPTNAKRIVEAMAQVNDKKGSKHSVSEIEKVILGGSIKKISSKKGRKSGRSVKR